MEGVIEQFFFLVCDSDHLTLVGVKCHQPFTLPGFKFWKIWLKGLTICMVWNGKIHYGVIGEEPDINLYHIRHIIYIQKKQTGSQHRTLWHTGHDRAGVRLLTFKHNSLGSVWKEGSNPGDNIIIYAKMMELQQGPFVIYLIKCLVKSITIMSVWPLSLSVSEMSCTNWISWISQLSFLRKPWWFEWRSWYLSR